MDEEKEYNSQEEIDDEEDIEEKGNQSHIFVCRLCGTMYDFSNPPKYLLPLNHYIVQGSNPLKIKCPNCNRVVYYDVVTKEEYEKYLTRKKEKAEKQKENKEARIRKQKRKQVREDLEDLAEDLKERLFNKEITPKRFVAIFTYMSRNIVRRYGKDLDVDWLDLRKTIFDLSDEILKVYKVEEKSEEILEEYSANIEEDELYKAELEYYIDDNEFSIPEYELNQRMKEYDRQEKKIRQEEYKKEIEEKYQKRKLQLLQKAEERKRRQKLRDIM